MLLSVQEVLTILYCKLLYKMDQDFWDIKYQMITNTEHEIIHGIKIDQKR